jgi:hypothetical protein
MQEVNAQLCEGCDVAILLDHEEHHADETGAVWHHWCVEEISNSEADDLAEELAIEEAREEGKL